MDKVEFKTKVMSYTTYKDLSLFLQKYNVPLREFDKEMLDHLIELMPRNSGKMGDICEDPRECLKWDRKRQ